MSKEKAKEVMSEFHDRTDEVLDILKTFPKEILFMLRSTYRCPNDMPICVPIILTGLLRSRVLVRALNMELGSPVNRFAIFGRQSARALRIDHSAQGLVVCSLISIGFSF